MNDNPDNFKVNRTMKGTIFELVCGALLLVSWVIAIVMTIRHGFQSFTQGLIVNTATFTFVVVLLLVLVYFPKTFNLPKNPKPAHYKMTVELMRVLSVCIALLSLILNMVMMEWISTFWQFVVFVLMMIILAYYLFRFFRIK